MKKQWLKKRILIWIRAMVSWSCLALILFILILLKPELTESILYGIMVWIMLLSFLLLLVIGRFRILEPLGTMRKKIELFNDGIIFTEIFKSLEGISPDTDALLLKMDTILDKDKMMENAKQQARYLALQNQINPHFLYNVLESIRSDALMAGVPEIGKITEALAVFFRYTTSKMERLSTLQEELANVENYFLIQKYRFDDKLELKIQLPRDDDEILKTRIPKLTLQPIVENAIKHGLEPKVSGGTVIIDIEHSDTILYLSVIDNGIGIEEARLESLNEKLSRIDAGDGSANEGGKGGIALINVNSRIRLLMGDEYGLHILSTPRIGTEVRLILPYMFEPEEGRKS
ncbi:sensor histidine kinase [Lacrimispora saccharolytica]|uniref:Integral membrane sensor signal transduction histidine kinase n=1 Tax=Lacrimispora saccharolytica (strain ATCC 35040 / DSM 2544 / NRCC 2533 / WM1) TaxID=610130 RepID=D9R0L8_LACSW|nr:histidine kinase [Lacrimispora saccharolytica]ADL02667.1 integral membrane sensor signal transduction histidine kinase [[Clostridium] saccharolyticum WM1]QRV19115.1 histidine kinase [Lacrimispora saccharolytica]